MRASPLFLGKIVRAVPAENMATFFRISAGTWRLFSGVILIVHKLGTPKNQSGFQIRRTFLDHFPGIFRKIIPQSFN